MRFVWILLAHSIGDGVLRIGWDSPYGLIAHSAVWTICVAIALRGTNGSALWKVLFLFFGHLIIDYWNVGGSEIFTGGRIIDQVLHLTQLLIVYFL
jgi:hypothetical protein